VPPQPAPAEPQPAPAQPQPAPAQPQPAPPQPAPAGDVPAQKTSPIVNLRITPGEHGATLKLGTPIQLCYGAQAGIWVKVFDARSGELLFPEGPDDGNGDCRSDLAAGPVGIDTVRIEAYANAGGTKGALQDFATLSTNVVP
jgi:hypothetical protein